MRPRCGLTLLATAVLPGVGSLCCLWGPRWGPGECRLVQCWLSWLVPGVGPSSQCAHHHLTSCMHASTHENTRGQFVADRPQFLTTKVGHVARAGSTRVWCPLASTILCEAKAGRKLSTPNFHYISSQICLRYESLPCMRPSTTKIRGRSETVTSRRSMAVRLTIQYVTRRSRVRTPHRTQFFDRVFGSLTARWKADVRAHQIIGSVRRFLLLRRG
jgi:hypothetical protein